MSAESRKPLRSVPHNGKMYQTDDVEYMLGLAETCGRGLGAIAPQWFRDQAMLIKGSLDRIAELEATLSDEEAAHQETLALWQRAKERIAELEKQRDALRYWLQMAVDYESLNANDFENKYYPVPKEEENGGCWIAGARAALALCSEEKTDKS